ncbi:MAG: magnesium chelatase ATPase subunit D [Alphaproteobacteria bacterium PA1]|nr:MAG: magnesium chelatase ATPase subunit D [Alphaproteobacteria bacterium PA1]
MTQEAQTDSVPCAAWPEALLIATLFAMDPHGLGGISIKGRSSPFFDAWLDLLKELLPEGAPLRRCPVQTGDDRLLGGLDLATSLALGQPVVQRGLLSEVDGGVLVLPMAERLSSATAARIAAALDEGQFQLERDGLTSLLPARFGLILLDESIGPEESPPFALLERCSFRLDGNGLGLADLAGDGLSLEDIQRAKAALPSVGLEQDALVDAICEAAQAFGLHSARPALLCLRVARMVAALDGRKAASLGDVTLAAQLVLAPQALQLPPPPEEPTPDEADQQPENQDEADPAEAESEPAPPPETPPDTQAEAEAKNQPNPSEVLVDAVKSALPAELIAALGSQAKPNRQGRASGSGGGAMQKSPLRGRPIRSRSGTLKPGERLNIIETLRAAAPWQKLRRRPQAEGATGMKRIEVRKSDFRIRCFAQPKEATTILVVDASGSSAFQRLAEAKGAVELLLAQAYVDRSRVALVAFRNETAEVLLPPTRSLARARRQLSDLAGGGGTPLAAGIDTALMLALAEKAKGRTPRLLFLTDGRGNIGREGKAGRAVAMADALLAARAVGLSDIAAVHIDTSPFPRPGARELAEAMRAIYAPLPYLNAQAISAI